MRKKEIEKKLNTAISNSVPNVLDNIITKCENKKGFTKNSDIMKKDTNLKQKNKYLTPKLTGALALIAVCIITFIGINQYNDIYKTDSIISFDVNPSIEIKTNKDKEIIEVTSLNKEGKEILDDMDLKNVDLDVATNAIIGSMLKNGYLTVDENSILVSVKNNDIKKANELTKEITDDINEILNKSSIKGSILSQVYDDNDKATTELANKNNISEGKARLINNILNSNIKDSKGNNYTFESLSKLSINELNLLLSSKNTEIKNTNTQGEASTNSYITKENAKQKALSDAGISENDIRDLEIELDADAGILIYEIEFKTSNNEYEYEINARTGEIINKNTDLNDDTYDDNHDDHDDYDDYDDYDNYDDDNDDDNDYD